MSHIEIIQGDCLEVMAGIETGSFDAVVTDQPYGTGFWKRPVVGAGGDPTCQHSQPEWDVW